MIVENIHVTDPDSLDAAADVYESYFTALRAAGITESYDEYCRKQAEALADEYAAEHGAADEYDDSREPNDGLCLLVSFTRTDDPEPEPPAPAALSSRRREYPPCPCCKGYGVMPRVPRTEHSGEECWYCGGTGEDRPLKPITRDRREHLRRIGQTGGMVTFERYGSQHYRTIGKAGYAATVKAHGKLYATALLNAKGWTPRKPDLLADLTVGRQLAALDRLAA